jgi:hypothetical protein
LEPFNLNTARANFQPSAQKGIQSQQRCVKITEIKGSDLQQQGGSDSGIVYRQNSFAIALHPPTLSEESCFSAEMQNG